MDRVGVPEMVNAQDAVQEILIDIWKNAERFDESKASETTFIAMLARRRLIDRIRYSARIEADSIDDILLAPSSQGDETMQVSIDAGQAAGQCGGCDLSNSGFRAFRLSGLKIASYSCYSFNELKSY